MPHPLTFDGRAANRPAKQLLETPMSLPKQLPTARAAAAVAATAFLAACSTPNPISQDSVEQAQIENYPAAPSVVIYPTDSQLRCVGDKLREAGIQPIVVGHAVADSTGKVNGDVALMTRRSLSVVASRGNNVMITNMGYGNSAKPEMPSVEELLMRQDPTRAGRMIKPDILFTGGVKAVSQAFMSLQKTAGLTARDVDAGRASTVGVDLATLSFQFKDFNSGIDAQSPTIEIRASYQNMSRADEFGVFATGSLNGKTRSAGIRFGRTVAINQIADDAVQTAVDKGVADAFAQRYSLDLTTCPAHPADVPPQASHGERLPTINELPTLYRKLDLAERIRWFQAVLEARGYAPGAPDGKLGPRTSQALSRAAADVGLPPAGQPTEALYYALATQMLARGQDPRQPPPPVGPQGIHVQLQQPNASYWTGTLLRSTVVVPLAGHLRCWWLRPDGGALSLFPILAGRPNFVTANAPVVLPDPNASGSHPRVRLTQAGSHELWCGQARRDITDRLPAQLRPGAAGQGFDTSALLRAGFMQAAGVDFIAEGSVRFGVVEPTPQQQAARQ